LSEHAEQTLIASCFSHPTKTDAQEYLLELTPDCFEGVAESALWGAMRDLVMNGLPINETSIRQQLAAQSLLGVDGQYWPTYRSLLIRCDEPIEKLAQEVKDSWTRRNLEAIFRDHQAKLLDLSNGADAVAQQTQDALAALVAGGVKESDPWAEIALKIERGETMEQVVRQGGWLFPEFDDAYQIPVSAVTFIVARLNTGKTLLGLTAIRETVRKGNKATWVNQDMPDGMMKIKLISCFSGVPQWKIQKQAMSMDEGGKVKRAIDELREMVAFQHYPGMTPLDKIKPKVIQTIRRHKPTLVVWDQFSQIGKDKSTGKRDDVQAAYISRSIKNLAASTDTAVLMLAQANRGANNSEPSMADIAETDAIGQDACGVITLWNNEDRAKKAEMAGDDDLFGSNVKTSEKFKNVPYVDMRLSKSQVSEAGRVWHLYRDGERNQFIIHSLET
jgi:replicative DNA helicase